MAGNFVLKRGAAGYYFVLNAGNGETILTSEIYVQKQSAESGIFSVKVNASDPDRYQKKSNANGQYMFNLLAANGRVIGTSEPYSTPAARDKGIESVMVNAPSATTSDLAGA